MTDIDPNVPPVVDDKPNVDPPAKPAEGSLEWYKAEADKWKGLSRKHEDRSKDLLKENGDLKNASMSDAEKAIEAARKEGESSTLKKVTERLVKAELKAIAAQKGVTLPDVEALNLGKFATDDGDPDEEAIEKFVDSLGGSKNRFPNGKDLGIGQSSGSGKKQWTRADLKGKTHAEIVAAREAGHLDKLMGND
jgi:hypothetical protein